jgi:predicted SAM-dependent methyltransferase
MPDEPLAADRGPLAGLQRDNPRRLHLGCGPFIAPGWLNCDLRYAPGVNLCADLRAGLPLADASIDCIAAIHVLQDLTYDEVRPALRELHRILGPGGVLRLGLPDLDKALCAYLAGDAAFFYVPDKDAASIGTKLVTQLTWYGSVRTPFTYDCIREWLLEAGFGDVYRCEYRITLSRFAELADLDNRERESLFVEAV